MSHETPQATRDRLLAVLAKSDIDVHTGRWNFVESVEPVVSAGALAAVTDGQVWSQLVPATGDDGGEQFGMLTVHFPADVDNSGFVGWLATELKQRLGTGVFVICGQNSARGGIFDHWGAPAELFGDVLDVVRALQAAGRR